MWVWSIRLHKKKKRSSWLKRLKSLTQRWLQHVSISFTSSYWLDVWWVNQPPEVISVVTTVQTEPKTSTHHAHHCGNAHRVRVSRIPCLKFHACFEVIGGRGSGLQTNTKTPSVNSSTLLVQGADVTSQVGVPECTKFSSTQKNR